MKGVIPSMSELEQAQAQQLNEMLQHIEDLMQEENYSKAQDVLNYALRLDLFDLRVYERYAFVLRMQDNHQAADLFEKVVINPNNPDAYYGVSRALFNGNQYGPAINPLRKVVELVPMAANAIFELGYAYMKEFELTTSLQFLQQAFEMQPNPHAAFYVGYVSLLLDDLETAKAQVPFMAAEFEKSGDEPHMLKILQEMIERYEAFPPQNLRDWHFVQYGQPLLRLSSEDVPESAEQLNGRYVFINYGFLNIATALQTLKRLSEEVPNFPKFDYILPASMRVAPIAFALSQMLGIEMEVPEALDSDRQGLVLTSWTDEVDHISQFLAGRAHVTLFSFSLGWTLQANVCPEVIGYFDQANRLPWEETVEVSETGERTLRPAMTAPPEVIGHYILDRLEATPTEEIDAVVNYYKERAHLLKVGDNVNQPRLGFQIESPIQSPRMMV